MPGTGRMACMLRCTGGSVIVRARERTRARGRGWADRCARGGGWRTMVRVRVLCSA